MFDVTSSSKTTVETLTRSMSQAPANERRRNYRFYAGDPAIHPAEKRLYANGDFEGAPLHVSGCTDPRNSNRPDRSYQDLPVPKFKLDRCWVGAIPAKEVTFRNLNDNITKAFLTDMCKRFGDIDDCKIYYDRQTKKHLGLGTVIFKTTKAARECVNALNMTTKMGSMISVSLETSGQERTKQYATMIRAQEQEKAAQEKALAASAAASPPPSTESNLTKPSDRSQMPVNHKISNNHSHSSASYSNRDRHRGSRSSSFKRNATSTRENRVKHHSYKIHSTSSRYESRGHSSANDNADQFSFDPYGSFGNNSNSNKSSSRRSRHHSSHRRPHSQQRRRRRKTSSSASTSSTSHSSSSSSSSTSTSTSRSYSRSSSSSSRSSYSSTHSRNQRPTNSSRTSNSKQQRDDEDHRPSLDERIAALFQQQQQTTNPSSMPSKAHHRPLPLPHAHPPTSFPYPPPPLSAPMTNIVGSHHHHQQSYGVVNNFNFFGNSFPPASFLNSAGGTNWQDMFKQPPPESSTTPSAAPMHTHSHSSTNGFQPQLNDGADERERKTNELTSAVTNIVTGELVEILRKDLAKKLIETLVYKSIETWYDNEERKDKIKKIKSAESAVTEPTPSHEQSSTQLHHSLSNPSLERIPDETPVPVTPSTAPPFSSSASSTNLSTYFEHMKDIGSASVRAQMPKIPSFKKRIIPDEKPPVPQKPVTPTERKEPRHEHQQRKISRKRLSSSSSESNQTPENDDSQSRDSTSLLPEDISSLDIKSVNKASAEPHTPEEEEGEIKDDEEVKAEEENHALTQADPEPTPPPPPPPPPTVQSLATPPAKKSTTKTVVKQPKKSGPPKKRKIEHVKSEPTDEQDDLDNSTLAKRKKGASAHHHVAKNNEPEIQPTQTFNLLDSLPEQTRSPPKSSYDRFAYIEFEHDYAFMAKQPVPVAQRLTVDGLNDMGVQAPLISPPAVKFPPREHDAEMRIMYELDHGVDDEDMLYLKRGFQRLCEEGHSCTTKTRWVDHPASRDSPFAKHLPQKHRTGCARTEGYYKVVKNEEIILTKITPDSQSSSVPSQAILDANRTTTGAQMSRELRSEHRRNLLALGDAEFADHFKFSQLKLRKKRLRYAKSGIHAWGLFACEPIAMEDMVIEYVGETIRQSVGDLREKQYELEGINSNYMFRVDSDTIVDATKCGNLARFINHSCDPNCYAKIIPVESQKKIVIYSKRDIRLGEEITYDYKFPLEEQKIPCRCGTPTCRGSLN